MPKTVDNYIIGKSLFKDSFEIEYLFCEHKILRKPFTLKKIEKTSEEFKSEEEKKSKIRLSFACSCLQNEIQISRQLKSEKVIKCLKLLKAKNAIYAVYEEHPEKTLQKILSTQYLTTQKKQTILNEILQLVKDLHQANVAVGNLQPCNLFVSSDYKIQISNFLIARKVEDNQKAKVDQLFLDSRSIYLAPELLKNGSLTKAADIYSIGQIIKTLKFQKTDYDHLTPVKSCYQNVKDLVDKMIDENPINRPGIIEFDKNFALNKSRNKSTCGSNASMDNEQKMLDLRGLESYKSEAILRICTQKIQASNFHLCDSKKTILTKRETFNQDILLTKPRKINLKSKTTIELGQPLQSSRIDKLQIPEALNVRLTKSGKSICSATKIEQNQRQITSKQKFEQLVLMRNSVSFLIEMTFFVNGQENFKDLCYYMVQEALTYTINLLNTINSLMTQSETRKESLKYIVKECQRQRKTLTEILLFFNKRGDFKKPDNFLFEEQLKRFGKFMLTSYSSDFSILSKTSQVCDSPRKIKQVIDPQKTKQNQDKLFRTLMILKRLQYGNYFDFFKAKVHHFNKKFWNEHYFQFQKTFGGKYFVIQIKDLINKK